MEELVFTCETVTPMFCYGADGQTPEIRAQSIKGALRFWWRAMQEESDSKKLFTKEADIFGHASNEKKLDDISKKCLFSLIIKDRGVKTKDASIFNDDSTEFTLNRKNAYNNKVKSYKIKSLAYLAYGPFYRSEAKEHFEAENSQFDIIIRMPQINDKIKKELLKTLFLLTNFGGIGSKSRNGFGSFRIIEASEELISPDIAQMMGSDKKPYSSFCTGTELWTTKNAYPAWDQALNVLAQAYITAKWRIDDSHDITNRQYLTQPIKGKKGRDENLNLERRSKPYFLHIDKISDSEYVGSILLLPSIFHDKGETINSNFIKAISKFNSELDKMEEIVRIPIL